MLDLPTAPSRNRYARTVIDWLSGQPQATRYEIARRLSPVREEAAYDVFAWIFAQPECERAIACEILWNESESFSEMHRSAKSGTVRSRHHRHLWQIIDRAACEGFPSKVLGWCNNTEGADRSHRSLTPTLINNHRRALKERPHDVLVLPDHLLSTFGGKALPDVTQNPVDISIGEWNRLAPSLIALGAMRYGLTRSMAWPRRVAYRYLGWHPIGGRISLAAIVLIPALAVGIAIVRDWYLGHL